jgi:hypothetical protein
MCCYCFVAVVVVVAIIQEGERGRGKSVHRRRVKRNPALLKLFSIPSLRFPVLSTVNIKYDHPNTSTHHRHPIREATGQRFHTARYRAVIGHLADPTRTQGTHET